MSDPQQTIDQQKALLGKAKAMIDKLRQELADKDVIISEEKSKREKLEEVISQYVKSDVKEQEDVAQVIEQYETRLKRMQEHYESNEKNLHEALERIKTQKERQQVFKSAAKYEISNLISQSEEIREACLQFLGAIEGVDEGYKSECHNKVKLLLVQLQKLSFEDDVLGLNYLKNHFLLLHQSIFDVNKRLQLTQKQVQQLEQQSQEIHDTLTGELLKEKKEKAKHIENGRNQIKHLESTIEHMNSEHQKIIAAKDAKMDNLLQQQVRNANLEYVKNVIIGFFCNDVSVQRKTIPVIATVLQLTDNEHKQIREAFDSQQRGTIGRFLKL